jgi:adenylate cyclase
MIKSACLFFILAICCFLSACQGQYSGKKQPEAMTGILDLSEWDFDRDGTIKLDGEWEYYEGQSLTPDSFRIQPGPEKTDFREALPRRLTFNKVVGKQLSGKENATFRLTIKFKNTDKIYGLELVHFSSPHQLWADGKLLYPGVGMGENPKTILSQFLPLTTTFQARDQTAQIILQTISPLFVRVGLARSIEIGTESQIAAKSNNWLVFDLFLLGSLLTLAIYHFYLFALRRKEVSTLYMGGLCLLTAFLYMMPAERFLVVLWPNFDWQTAGKLEYLCVCLGLMAFVMYTASIYPQEFYRKMIWAAHGFGGLFTLLIIVTDMASQPYTMIVGGVMVLAFSLYLVLVLISASLKKRGEAIYSLTTLILLLGIIINDILYNQGVISTGRFLPYGGFIFILAQSLILCLRFQKSFVRIDAYERFIPREFLKNLGKEAIDNVKLGDNVEKEMTVLFSDIRNFTTLSEQMTPKETFKFINSYLSVMGPVIRKHHGFIDKFIGDAIMALYDTSASADDAVGGGIGMLQTLREYNQGRIRAGYHPVAIGIGINTGTLRIGIVGERDRMEATVISDTVNLASRIEGMTKMYGISLLISDATYHALEDPKKYHIRKIDRVKVRGKTKPVTLWEVFDLDPPELLDYKLKIAVIFDEAISLYHSRQFEEAHELFLDCLTRNPRDRTAEFYAERCKLYMKMGDEEDWGAITRRVIYERE